MTLTIGSLFSGIGGLELGLERAGLGPTLWQVESDPYAQRVLAKYWPAAVRYGDVRSVGRDLATVDIICGGFPCQDLSHAGSGWDRPGLDGNRSGLWRHFCRIVGELAPTWVVAENVAAPWRTWVPVVRGDLARHGYASVSVRLSAEDVGAPFKGERIFVIATTDDKSESLVALNEKASELPAPTRHDGQSWGSPHPELWEWLMGFPIGWTALDASATPSSRKSQK